MIQEVLLTFKDGTDLPDGDGAEACELADGDLQKEQRHPNEDEACQVGDEEDSWNKTRNTLVALE